MKNQYQASLWTKYFKRIFDFSLALIALILAIPIFLVIYLYIWLEESSTPIFKQERIGYKGKPFMIYKFRTMCMNAECGGEPKLWDDCDQRVTKIGSFLRKTHLDEVPQIWNVLKGDMSWVGYRPERQFFINQIIEKDNRYLLLYKMRPGVFSYATLYNGYTNTIEKMVTRLEMDLEYIKKSSFLYDLNIIFTTLVSIILGKKL